MHRFPAALLAAAALAAGFSPALAKETVPVDRPLPVDDRYDVRETLPSGLKLYVRHHEVPKGMVAMWLHFGTGSVNETDAERGLAHFLEHMAFRGSTHFKPGTVTSRFEDLGVRFGRDQNAMTSFDQTTYQIALPRTDPHAISEALLFLSDVAHRLALLDPEIDDELVDQAISAFYDVRGVPRLRKKPSTSELIDWIAVLAKAGIGSDRIKSELPFGGVLIKKEQDQTTVAEARSGRSRRW